MVFWHFHGPICPSSKITSLLTTPHSAPALVRDSELLFPMHFNLPWQTLNSSCHFITWPLSVLRLLQLLFICTSSNNPISPANKPASSDVLYSPRLSARILLTVPVLLFAAHSFISEKTALKPMAPCFSQQSLDLWRPHRQHQPDWHDRC